MRKVGLVLLGLLLFICFMSFFSVMIIFPVTFIFGPARWLYYVQLAAVYFLSAAAAAGIVIRLWNPKPKKATQEKPISNYPPSQPLSVWRLGCPYSLSSATVV